MSDVLKKLQRLSPFGPRYFARGTQFSPVAITPRKEKAKVDREHRRGLARYVERYMDNFSKPTCARAASELVDVFSQAGYQVLDQDLKHHPQAQIVVGKNDLGRRHAWVEFPVYSANGDVTVEKYSWGRLNPVLLWLFTIEQRYFSVEEYGRERTLKAIPKPNNRTHKPAAEPLQSAGQVESIDWF